jgi:hypothetical protein
MAGGHAVTVTLGPGTVLVARTVTVLLRRSVTVGPGTLRVSVRVAVGRGSKVVVTVVAGDDFAG